MREEDVSQIVSTERLPSLLILHQTRSSVNLASYFLRDWAGLMNQLSPILWTEHYKKREEGTAIKL